jgi:hypothetical protein
VKKLGTMQLLASIGLVSLFSSIASAHTVSVGYVPTSTGSVTFWAGAYNHGTSFKNEGTGTLVGVDAGNTYNSGIIPFNIPVVGTKPSGLVDGINNFYFSPTPGSGGDCTVGAVFGSSTYTCNNGPVAGWEGITFTGLTAGTYDFSISNDTRTTALFQNPGAGSVRVILTSSDVSGPVIGTVPEPTSIALFGLGMLGFAASYRKPSKRNNA